LIFTSIVNHCICPVELIKRAILSIRSVAIDAVKFGRGDTRTIRTQQDNLDYSKRT